MRIILYKNPDNDTYRATVIDHDDVIRATTGTGDRAKVLQTIFKETVLAAWHDGYEAATRGDPQLTPEFKIEEVLEGSDDKPKTLHTV